MELPRWAEYLLSGIGPGGIAATIIFFVLSTGFYYLRAVAAWRQAKAARLALAVQQAKIAELEREVELKTLEIEGETESKARERLTSSRNQTAQDLTRRDEELRNLETELATANREKQNLVASMEENRQQLARLNESQRNARKDLVTAEAKVAQLESKRDELRIFRDRTEHALHAIGKELRKLNTGKADGGAKSPKKHE